MVVHRVDIFSQRSRNGFFVQVADPSAQVRETAKASLLPRRESISFSTIADESTCRNQPLILGNMRLRQLHFSPRLWRFESVS